MVIYGRVEYGGMELVKRYVLQDQLHLVNLMKHLRWKKGANDILVTLDNIQLAVGFIRPVLKDTSWRLDSIHKG